MSRPPLRPALAEHPGDTARGERPQSVLEIDMTLGVEGRALDHHPRSSSRRAARPAPPLRRSPASGRPWRLRRAASLRAGADGCRGPPARVAVDLWQPHGQGRIVGQRRAGADHDRVVGRAHDLDAQIGDLSGDARRGSLAPRRRSRRRCARVSASPRRPCVTRRIWPRWSRRAGRPRRRPRRRSPRLSAAPGLVRPRADSGLPSPRRRGRRPPR